MLPATSRELELTTDTRLKPSVRMQPKACVRHSVQVPLASGFTGTLSVFENLCDGRTDHMSLSFGDFAGEPPLVRVHSECLTGDVFGSLRCDCGPQLAEAIERCGRQGGIILYLRQEGRGIGLANKIAAYALQDQGLDTFAANRALGYADDERNFLVAAQMLNALGVTRIQLLSNNPDKRSQLEKSGIEIVRCTATIVNHTRHNHAYLAAKREQAGHSMIIPKCEHQEKERCPKNITRLNVSSPACPAMNSADKKFCATYSSSNDNGGGSRECPSCC